VGHNSSRLLEMIELSWKKLVTDNQSLLVDKRIFLLFKTFSLVKMQQNKLEHLSIGSFLG
jgi:hypothetical protein